MLDHTRKQASSSQAGMGQVNLARYTPFSAIIGARTMVSHAFTGPWCLWLAVYEVHYMKMDPAAQNSNLFLIEDVAGKTIGVAVVAPHIAASPSLHIMGTGNTRAAASNPLLQI